MRIRVQRRNISQQELATAISGIIDQEDVADLVMSKLQKSDAEHGEIIPEKYVRTIADKMDETYRSLRLTMDQNVDKLLAFMFAPKKGFLKKADDGPLLTDEQIDELRRLIEGHFRHAVGLSWGVNQVTQKRWEKAGITLPQDDFLEWVVNSYVSGRLTEVLKDSDTYGQMTRMAKKLPMSRTDMLALEAARMNAAQFIKGYGRKLADQAEEVLQMRHRGIINNVIQAYFGGNLKHTARNDDGLLPEEVVAIQTNKQVSGWRELSAEMRNRFKAVDATRNWDTVAKTEIRYAVNLGKFMAIQHEGGGDADDIEVYFHVQPTACKHCKELYLNSDGTPRIFKLSELLGNIEMTGGMNVGRKASQIGDSGGWLPNAVVHPNCHCYPVRVIQGYPTIPTGDLR